MKLFNQKGLTLVEVLISLLLFGVLGLATFSTLNFSKKATDNRTEDIQLLLSQLGASKLIARDLDASLPSFNFINLRDDANRPFFVWATNELCQVNCQREIKLKIGSQLTSDKTLYLIVRKGNVQELEKFMVNPEDTFILSGSSPSFTATYPGINRYFNDANRSISKSYRSYSPWSKDRILLLSSLVSFNDCNNSITGASTSGSSCATSCPVSGTCSDFAATRPIKVLGYVDSQEKDLASFSELTSVNSMNILPLNLGYRLCQQDVGNSCTNAPSTPLQINSARSLLENLPYVPGRDNRAFLTPVELVRYYLKRSSIRDPATKVQLIREKGFLKNGKITWAGATVMISGIESFNLRRPNISEPLIEYDLKLVSTRKP